MVAPRTWRQKRACVQWRATLMRSQHAPVPGTLCSTETLRISISIVSIGAAHIPPSLSSAVLTVARYCRYSTHPPATALPHPLSFLQEGLILLLNLTGPSFLLKIDCVIFQSRMCVWVCVCVGVCACACACACACMSVYARISFRDGWGDYQSKVRGLHSTNWSCCSSRHHSASGK